MLVLKRLNHDPRREKNNEGESVTLQDAIASGKKFRRSHMIYGKEIFWCEPGMGDNYTYTFKWADLVATDWYLEEPTISFTEAQLREAHREACKMKDWSFIDAFLKKLGF